jgi:hypothetical protein
MTEGSDLFTRSADVQREDFDAFLAAIQKHQTRRVGRQWSIYVVAALGIATVIGLLDPLYTALMPHELGREGALYGFKVGIAFTVVIGGGLVLGNMLLMGQRFARLDVKAIGHYTYRFSAAGLEIDGAGNGTSRIPWRAISRLETTDRVLVLWLDDLIAFLVPRLAFADAADEAEVLAAMTFWAPHLMLPAKA